MVSWACRVDDFVLILRIKAAAGQLVSRTNINMFSTTMRFTYFMNTKGPAFELEQLSSEMEVAVATCSSV